MVATALLLGSPGPAPLALAATGATYGARNGIPFLLGILAGLAVALMAVAAGIAALYNSFPGIRLTVQIMGAMYILYLAQKIARAPVLNINDNKSVSAPTFVDGFILNLLNPKAYAAFLAVFSQFLLPLQSQLSSTIYTAVICFLVAVVVDIVWLLSGNFLRQFFETPESARIMHVTFAILMVIAVAFALLY